MACLVFIFSSFGYFLVRKVRYLSKTFKTSRYHPSRPSVNSKPFSRFGCGDAGDRNVYFHKGVGQLARLVEEGRTAILWARGKLHTGGGGGPPAIASRAMAGQHWPVASLVDSVKFRLNSKIRSKISSAEGENCVPFVFFRDEKKGTQEYEKSLLR